MSFDILLDYNPPCYLGKFQLYTIQIERIEVNTFETRNKEEIKMLSNLFDRIYYPLRSAAYTAGGVIRDCTEGARDAISNTSGGGRGEIFTNTMDVFYDPDIEEKRKTHPSEYKANNYCMRQITGYRVLCHVFAYLRGLEPLQGDYWPEDRRKLADVIAKELKIPELYNTHPTRTFDEYGVNSSNRAIITPSMILHAYKLFPIEEITNILKNSGYLEEPEEEPTVITVDVEVVSVDDTETSVNHEDAIDMEPSDVPTESERADEDTATFVRIVNPIFTYSNEDLNVDLNNLDPKKLTPKQEESIKEKFGKYFPNGYDAVRTPSGEIILYVKGVDTNEYLFNCLIDPGLYLGNGYNIISYIPTSDGEKIPIPVNETETGIFSRLFSDPNNNLTSEEIEQCNDILFKDFKVYNIIDMSNMTKRLSMLTDEEFSQLGDKLSTIISTIIPERLGRLRFSKYKSINDFTLVSDSKCKSPFPQWTLSKITGIEVIVRGDKFTIKFNSKTEDYSFTE